MNELLWLISDLKLSDDAIVVEHCDSYDENGLCYDIVLRDCLGLDADGCEVEREYDEPELVNEFLTMAYRAACVWNYNENGGKNLYYDGFYITIRFSSEIY